MSIFLVLPRNAHEQCLLEGSSTSTVVQRLIIFAMKIISAVSIYKTRARSRRPLLGRGESWPRRELSSPVKTFAPKQVFFIHSGHIHTCLYTVQTWPGTPKNINAVHHIPYPQLESEYNSIFTVLHYTVRCCKFDLNVRLSRYGSVFDIFVQRFIQHKSWMECPLGSH